MNSPSSSALAICCANCIDPFPTLPFKPASKFIVSITRSLPDDIGEAVDFKPVAILDALKTIFGFTFSEDDDEDGTVEDYLVLCSKCTEHLAKLYELYCGFKRICNIDSYISTHKIEVDFNTFEREDSTSLKMKPDPNVVITTDIQAQTSSDIPNGHLHRLQERSSKETIVTYEASLPASSLRVRTLRMSNRVGQYNIDSESEDDDTSDGPPDALDIGDEDEDWKPRPEYRSNQHNQNLIDESDELNDSGSAPKMKRGRPLKSDPQRKESVAPKRKRGRPRKHAAPEQDIPKRKKGRPRKYPLVESTSSDGETASGSVQKFKRGRPRKGEIRSNKAVSDRNKRMKRGRPLMDLPGRVLDPENPRVFKCGLCGKEAKTNQNLRIHIRGVHEGYRAHQCLICKKYYYNKSHLVDHMKSVHNKEPNQYTCQEPGCGKAFAYPAGLRAHSFTHTGQTLFSCEICGKGFRRGCDLQSHKTRHTSARPFICEQCGGSFKSKCNLQKHYVTHDVEWKHQAKPQPTCQICKKTFLIPGNLRAHVRTVHEGLKPYKCQICGKAFSANSNLKVHLSGFHKCPKDANNDISLPLLLDHKAAGEVSSGGVVGSEPEDHHPQMSHNSGFALAAPFPSTSDQYYNYNV